MTTDPTPAIDPRTVETLEDVIALARQPQWSGRLSVQWYDDGQTGAGKYGHGFGSVDVRGLDEGEVQTVIANRCGRDDAGNVRSVSVAVRASHEDRKTYSRFIIVRIERAAVEAIQAEAGHRPATAAPVVHDERIERLERAVLQLADMVKAPSKTSVVDADPFSLMMRMQQSMAEQAREQRKEFADMLERLDRRAAKTEPATALAPVEVYQQLGKLQALADSTDKAASWAPIIAPALQELGGVVKQALQLQADRQQLQMAMWAKANGLQLQVTEEPQE